jgi:hypothetical protein
MTIGGSLTAANVVLALSVPGLFDTPQQIQGYAADEAFDFSDVESSETVMGVDGILSAGWLPKELLQSLSLQADSASNQFFEDWYGNQQQARDLLIASGTVSYPSVGKQYNLVRGFLKGYSPAPKAGKILAPRRYTIVWNYIQPSSFLGY